MARKLLRQCIKDTRKVAYTCSLACCGGRRLQMKLTGFILTTFALLVLVPAAIGMHTCIASSVESGDLVHYLYRIIRVLWHSLCPAGKSIDSISITFSRRRLDQVI